MGNTCKVKSEAELALGAGLSTEVSRAASGQHPARCTQLTKLEREFTIALDVVSV